MGEKFITNITPEMASEAVEHLNLCSIDAVSDSTESVNTLRKYVRQQVANELILLRRIGELDIKLQSAVLDCNPKGVSD